MMYKIFFLAVLILLSGCSTHTDIQRDSQANNKKTFDKEDMLIMYALRAEQVQDFISAAKLFEELYENSNKREYLHRSLQNYLYMKQNNKVISTVEGILNGSIDDLILARLKVVALLQENRQEEALHYALKIVEKSKDESDYILVSDIYLASERYDEALKYLESAYAREYSERILDKLSIVLYVNFKRTKDAIAYLETHTRVHGCSKMICKRLIAFYSNDNNLEGLISAYERYYKVEASKEVAKQLIQLYEYKKDFAKMILFLESSHSDDKRLLDLYSATKNYAKAYPLAQKLYEETAESQYLAQSVIYQYENQKNKNDKAFLTTISKKFEELLQKDATPLYLNYYGYLLIDHDLNIQKGIELVRKALEKEPNSPYYLDSLAWGLYKTGECKKAFKIIQEVRKLEGGDDLEVLKHYEIIKECKEKE